MKIRFSAIICLLVLAACKKNYQCSCATKYRFIDRNDSAGVTVVVQNSQNTYSEKMNKKQAKAACDNEALVLESDFRAGVTVANPLGAGESVSASCVLGLK